MKVKVPGGKLKLDTGLGEKVTVPSMWGLKVRSVREPQEPSRTPPSPSPPPVRVIGRPVQPARPARRVLAQTISPEKEVNQ